MSDPKKPPLGASLEEALHEETPSLLTRELQQHPAPPAPARPAGVPSFADLQRQAVPPAPAGGPPGLQPRAPAPLPKVTAQSPAKPSAPSMMTVPRAPAPSDLANSRPPSQSSTTVPRAPSPLELSASRPSGPERALPPEGPTLAVPPPAPHRPPSQLTAPPPATSRPPSGVTAPPRAPLPVGMPAPHTTAVPRPPVLGQPAPHTAAVPRPSLPTSSEAPAPKTPAPAVRPPSPIPPGSQPKASNPAVRLNPTGPVPPLRTEPAAAPAPRFSPTADTAELLEPVRSAPARPSLELGSTMDLEGPPEPESPGVTTNMRVPSKVADAAAEALSPASTQPMRPTGPRFPQPPEPKTEVSQGPWGPVEALEVVARPAPLWRRLLALAIDLAVLGGVVVVLVLLAAAIGPGKVHPSQSGLDALLSRAAPAGVPLAIVAALLGIGYATLFSLTWGGRTPGRFIAGLRLVDGSGRSPGPVRSGIRAVLSVLSFALGLFGFWLALVDRKGQTLHDKLTATYVVRLAR